MNSCIDKDTKGDEQKIAKRWEERSTLLLFMDTKYGEKVWTSRCADESIGGMIIIAKGGASFQGPSLVLYSFRDTLC